MLKHFDFKDFDFQYKDCNRSDLREEFGMIQRRAHELGIPILIVIDGWESAGKGYVISDLVREVDHKYTRVHLFGEADECEQNKPYLWRFWMASPARGEMSVFDHSYYFNVMDDFQLDKKTEQGYLKDIETLERQLTEDGTVIIKFFLNISQKTQRKRTEEYQIDKFKKVLVTERDRRQVQYHDEYEEHLNKILNATDFPTSPWNIIPSESMRTASLEVLGRTIEVLKSQILDRMDRLKPQEKVEITLPKGNHPLDKVNYSKKLSQEEYEEAKTKLESQMIELGYELHDKKIPTVIVFEGVDAAGKGGAIKRLTKGFDPRGYNVVPISAPSQTELSYHYMWRFWKELPDKGDITIFDRSWYGRVLVERVEGFAKEEEWKRAYGEINEMERIFCESGIFLLKFFLTIDAAEQLERFQARMLNIEKSYKLTEEDWRNREKWDLYTKAYNDMLSWTNKEDAPWILVPGNDKYYARIKVMEEVLERGRAFIKKREETRL